jgi:hypothetical protein
VKRDKNVFCFVCRLQFTLESDAAQGDSFDGNSISRGGTEVLLGGDTNLKADNRQVFFIDEKRMSINRFPNGWKCLF